MSSFNIPIFYSVFSRHKLIQENLNFFIKHRCTNVTFLVDKAESIHVENLKTIRLLQNFNQNFPCKLHINNVSHGSFCTFINYFTENNLIEPYSIFLEDDILLTDQFFNFHSMAAKRVEFLENNNYAIVIPFGFNCLTTSDSLKLISCNAQNIVGNLWGAGYLKDFVNDFFNTKAYKTASTTYLDSSILEYLATKNKKIIFTTHNLIDYCGIKDSKDKIQLQACLSNEQLFKSDLNFKTIDLDIDKKLLDLFLAKYNFFRNNCIDLQEKNNI